MTQSGPDAAGAHNVFIVEPNGFYAMMSIYAPAVKGKLEIDDPNAPAMAWAYWIEKILETPQLNSLFCHSDIACWVGHDDEMGFNQFANHMLAMLCPTRGERPMGTAVFTGMVAQIPPIPCGLTGDQFATLAAAYRTAARRIVPKMYGKTVELAGGM